MNGQVDEQPMTLAQIAPPGRRRWMVPTLVAVAVASLALAGAIGYAVASRPDPAPAAQPAQVAVTTAAATPAATPVAWANDPKGKIACDEIKKFNVSGGAYDAAETTAVAEIGKDSTRTEIRLAALSLAGYSRIAAATPKGASDEVRNYLSLMESALRLETACIKALYY